MPILNSRDLPSPGNRKDPIRAASAGIRRLLRIQTILLAIVGLEVLAFFALRLGSSL